MDQLSDLDDDCLIAVLDRLPPKELFKMQRLNRRMKRLATIKLQGKIKAIKLSPWKDYEKFDSACAHPDFFSQDQVLVLWPTVRHKPMNAYLYKPTMRATFLNILTKCAGIKSIDFDNFELPCDLLADMFRRCPELECIKFVPWLIELEEWDRALDQIGCRIIHFAKNFRYETPSDSQLLEMVACKCPNIKQVDWVVTSSYCLTRDLFAAFKILSKTCWIRFGVWMLGVLYLTNFEEASHGLPDVVNELDVYSLCWSTLGHRYDQLSSLKFTIILVDEGAVRGVEFAGLKRLEINGFREFEQQCIDCLIASSFPLLEEFCFNSWNSFTEADFDALFRRMTLIKKLGIVCDVRLGDFVSNLPQKAIQQLKNLEIIDLEIVNVDTNWQSTNLLQLLEQYVDGISSLKKLIVRKKISKEKDELEKAFEDEVKRMKLKQNHVEVVLINMKLS